MGSAYWALAALPGSYLTETDIADIRAYLRTGNPDKPRAVLLHYALGRALEEHGNFEESFPAYATAASLARQVLIEQGNAYDPIEEAGRLQQYRVAYTPEILSRRGPSATAADVVTPIFIVGMPRAGSTLLEQILASHSLVEGTIELPVMGSLTRQLDFSRRIKTPHAYPECVRNLSTSELAELGTRYIEEAKAFRKTRLSYFVDKRPWNWFEVGLIHLILPHAKISDVRREPMAACFALFKQSLASEPASYDFDDLAHYYTQYVDMLRYWDSVLPGRVHQLRYERLGDKPEPDA